MSTTFFQRSAEGNFIRNDGGSRNGGPVFWLDAEDQATIVRDASLRISTWVDKGSGKHNVTQTVDADKPTYTGTINGITVPEFDIFADKYLTNTAITDSLYGLTSGEIWLVVRFPDVVFMNPIFTLQVTGNNLKRLALFENIKRPQISMQDSGTGASGNVIADQTLSTGTNYLLRFQSDGDAYRIWVNGSEPGFLPGANDTGDWFGDGSPFETMFIGRIVGGFAGYLAEIKIWGSVLSDAKAAAETTALGTKWSVAV